MATLHSMLRRVGVRLTLGRALEWGARGLFAGGIVAIILLVVDRGIRAIELPSALYAAVCAAGALAGLFHGWLKRPRMHEVAAALDSKLALKDRFATAAAIEAKAVAPSEFGPLVQADAERVAQRLSPRGVSPLSYSHTWTAALLSVAALAAAIFYLPEYARASAVEGVRSKEEAVALRQSQAEAVAALEESIAQLREAPARSARDEDLARLDELAAQLRRGDLPPRDFAAARDAAAEELDAIARRAQSQAKRDEDVLEELNRRFESLGERERASDAAPTPADALADALSRAEYGEASQAIDNVARRIDEMSPAERAAVAEELRQLREKITEPGSEAAPAEATAESLRESLREQGLSNDVVDEMIPPAVDDEGQTEARQEEEQQPPSPREIAERLEEEGVEREQAERLAEQIAEERDRQQAREEAKRAAEELWKSLDQLADEIEEDRPADERDPSAREPESENEQPQRDDQTVNQREEGSQEQGDAEQQAGEESGQREQQRETTEGEERAQEREGNEGQTTEERRQREEQGAEQREESGGESRTSEQQQEMRDPAREQGQRQQEQRDDQGEALESEQPCPDCASGQPCPKHAGAKPGQREGESSENPQGAPRDDASETSEGAGSDPASGADESQSGRERVKELLEELEQRREGADETRRQSEAMRDSAREIAEKLTQEERERLERWSREFAQEENRSADPSDAISSGRDLPPGRGPGQASEPEERLDDSFFTDAHEMDLRDRGTDERTIAEWLADERPEGEPGRAGESAGPGLAGEAQRAAERAVNEGAVPRRYHDFIQRYFGRLRETLDKAAEKTDE